MGKLTAREKEIMNNMKVLDISREEAEELYAFDHEEIENEVVDKIESKMEEKKQEKEKRSSIESVKYMKAKIKGDANKEDIIGDIFDRTRNSDHVFHPQEMTSTKMSFVDKDGFHYTVQVTKHKARPDGYNADVRAEAREEDK